ncbi:hypothetical protein RN19_25515 [Xanthomonas phaseoli pv. phaseoli]|nr:hypothetical protein RN19_25515 [Xanthomonas phaseoli pv. phaseoli]
MIPSPPKKAQQLRSAETSVADLLAFFFSQVIDVDVVDSLSAGSAEKLRLDLALAVVGQRDQANNRSVRGDPP